MNNSVIKGVVLLFPQLYSLSITHYTGEIADWFRGLEEDSGMMMMVLQSKSHRVRLRGKYPSAVLSVIYVSVVVKLLSC